MPKNEERLIITMLRSQDKSELDKALLMLYDYASGRLKSFFVNKGVLDMDIEDLIQNTIVTVYRKMRQPDFVLTSSLLTFVFGVAHNFALMDLRLRRRRGDMGEEKEAADDFDIIEVMTKRDKYQRLKSLMEDIGEKCKEILVLYYFHELKMKEIAALMDYGSEQVAKNKKSSCLKKLKALFKETTKDHET